MRYSWLFLCVLVTFWLFDVVGLVNVTVDDQDPRLTYSEEWIHTTGKDYFNQTISLSAAGGFVSYTFVGTQIYAFGTHYAPASVSNYMFTYRIDDQAIVENYVDFSLEDQRLHRHLLFTSGPLLSHEHTLTLANASGSAGFGLDFLIVTTLAGSQNETQIPTATTTVQSSGTSGTIAVIPKPKLITTSSIVALSFGGLAIILIAIFGVLYCRSLKQPANSQPSDNGPRATQLISSASKFEAIMLGIPRHPQPEIPQSTSRRKHEVRFDAPARNKGRYGFFL